MRTDWYAKTVLTVIAVALATIALRPLLVPTPGYAAPVIEYKVTSYNQRQPQAFEASLNDLGKQGWELVALDFGGAAFAILRR